MPTVPAISFLLCTRNRAETARDCVIQLLSTSRKDIEVVVRDNCSTDNTMELLDKIDDPRLKIYSAPENQGTLTFFEIAKLAKGEILTWVSDEDNFQFDELNFILGSFRQDLSCDVLFGSIHVGMYGRKVINTDEIISDTVSACIIALSFSGCGGIFIRRSLLNKATSFNVKNLNDAYLLWNYYPVGFFASRCLERTMITTSRVVVVQSRFARTINNWSKITGMAEVRFPHYYPDSVFDRLTSNLVNVYHKPITRKVKIIIAYRLIFAFISSAANYTNQDFKKLLKENYPDATVDKYVYHIDSLGLNNSINRFVWVFIKLISLPVAFFRVKSNWKALRF